MDASILVNVPVTRSSLWWPSLGFVYDVVPDGGVLNWHRWKKYIDKMFSGGDSSIEGSTNMAIIPA